MVAASTGSLNFPFMPDISNPILENEIVDEERIYGDFDEQSRDDSDS